MRKSKILALLLLINLSYNVLAREKVKLHGLMLAETIVSNVDQTAATRFPNTNNLGYSTFCFPRANLGLDIKNNNNLYFYSNFNFRDSCGYGAKNDEWTFRKFGITDELYITMNNNTQNLSAKFGIQYIPFGIYDRHSIPATLPQLLSQTQAAGLTLTWKIHKLTLTPYLITAKTKAPSKQFINNFGFNLNYSTPAITIDAGIIYNMAASVNHIIHKHGTYINPLSSNYRQAVPGLALNIDLKHARWFTGLSLVSALQKFSNSDLAYKNTGAIPTAMLVKIGRENQILDYNLTTAISYQQSWQAVNIRGNNNNLGLPKTRWSFDLTHKFNKSLLFGAHLIMERSYLNTDKTSITGLFTVKYTFDLPIALNYEKL